MKMDFMEKMNLAEYCIDLKNYDYNFIQEVLLWTGWPVAILSFILSSIRSKEEVASKCRDDDSKKGG